MARLKHSPGDETVKLQAVRVADYYGRAVEIVSTAQSISVEIEFIVLQSGKFLQPALQFADGMGNTLFWSTDTDQRTAPQTKRKRVVDPIRNGYWLAHRLLKSRARVYYGDIYNISNEIGQFDVVLLGMVLPHLREPFYALAQTARLSRDVVIITQQAPKDQVPIAYFIPNARMNSDDFEPYGAWWVFSEGCFREMLQVLGFEIESITRQMHMCTARNPLRPRNA
jgi:hypothetical protein